MKRKKMTWAMKVKLDSNGYDPKACRCIDEDNVAWLFETTEVNEDGEKEIVTFWISKG